MTYFFDKPQAPGTSLYLMDGTYYQYKAIGAVCGIRPDRDIKWGMQHRCPTLGSDPGTSCMKSKYSTTWASPLGFLGSSLIKGSLYSYGPFPIHWPHQSLIIASRVVRCPQPSMRDMCNVTCNDLTLCTKTKSN